MEQQQNPKLSSGADESLVMQETKALIGEEGGWKLDADLMGVEKTYYFKTYTKAVVSRSVNSQFPFGNIIKLSYSLKLFFSQFGHNFGEALLLTSTARQ
jgi:hypothetical protein